MKRGLLFCLLLALLLNGTACAGTGSEQADESAYRQFCEGRTFADALDETPLKRPGRSITGLSDFIYALDYLAFYRIGKAVYFDVDPVYAQEFYNPYTEFQKAYQQADLADVYACQIDDSYYSQYHVIALKYSMSRDIASQAPAEIPDTPVVPSFDYSPSGDGFREIPLEKSGRPEIPCENGEQLYYLAMNGYRPIPEPGSAAELLYEEARRVIGAHIRPEQTDFQKIKAIYDYLTTEVRYDRETAYTGETYLVREQAYYLEGVFLNHCAVCDGKAKAYALLLNMLEIPCYRTTGVSGDADHAWNMVGLDGKWYVSCTTYGQRNAAGTLGRILPNYSMLLAGRLTPYGAEWEYTPQKHLDICQSLEEDPYDVYGAMSGPGINLLVRDLEELTNLLGRVAEQTAPEYKVEFQYVGQEGDTFREGMISYLSSLSHVNAMEIPSEGGTVYQIIYLSE